MQEFERCVGAFVGRRPSERDDVVGPLSGRQRGELRVGHRVVPGLEPVPAIEVRADEFVGRAAEVDVVGDPRAFPGAWQGIDDAGTVDTLVSYGAVDFVFTKDGARLDLAPGQQATVTLPVWPTLDTDG